MTRNAPNPRAAVRDRFTVVCTAGKAAPSPQGTATIDAGAFPEPAFDDLYTCWRRFGRRGEIPQRSALDPAALPRRLLPNLCILERLSTERKERFRYRLAGTAIEEAAGRSLTRRYLDEILPDNGYGMHLLRQIRLLLDRQAAVYSEGAYLTAPEPQVEGQTEDPTEGQTGLRTICQLMLPLTDEAGEIRYILAAQTFGTSGNRDSAPFLLTEDFRPGRVAVVRTP